MGWYNGGDWSELDAETIPYALADLCNAANERREALGAARLTWPVNTGSELSPTIGNKSANLSATDFFGLDIQRTDWLQDIYDAVSGLVTAVSMQSVTHHAGFAKTSTGIGAGSDLWTMPDLLTEVGISSPAPVESAFDAVAANFLREAFDRLIYPVIWPTNYLDLKDRDIGTGTRTYWYRGTNGAPRTPGSAAVAFGNLAPSDIDGIHSTFNDSYLHIIATPNYTGYGFSYAARAMTKTVLRLAPRTVGFPPTTIVGYPGEIKKAIAAVRVTPSDCADPVSFNVLGAPLVVDDGIVSDYVESTRVELEVDGSGFDLLDETFPTMELPAFPSSNPFDGVGGFGNPSVSSGVGGVGVLLACKYEAESGTLNTLSGARYTRLILDISSELTDQA